jgi:hypothetical protein
MISNILRLLIFLLLLNIILGLNTPSADKQRAYHLLKQRSADNDNEYVWFTRDIHEEMSSEDTNEQQQQQRKQQDLYRFKLLNNMFNRKYPIVKNSMDETN